MQLFYTIGSPFARKVRVLIRERGAGGLVEEVLAAPLEEPAGLREANPLGKIPVLIVPGMEPIFDSPVICEYLDATLPGQSFLPATGAARWNVLRRQALADGIMDAAFSWTVEKMRHDTAPSQFWMLRWRKAIEMGLAQLEADASSLTHLTDLGAIAVACALGYLDFRHPDVNWQSRCPNLQSWFLETAMRASLIQTEPL